MMSLRVAYITHYTDLYGANRSLLDLVRELRHIGTVEPFVLMPRKGRLSEVLEAEGIPHAIALFEPWMAERHFEGGLHHRLSQFFRHVKATRQRLQGNRRALPGLISIVQAWNVDIVHANSSAVGIAVDLADGLGKPLVWHIREMPERQYGLHVDTGVRGFGRALSRARHLIPVSYAVRDDVQRYVRVLPAHTVIYNGVLSARGFADHLEARASSGRRSSPFTFVLVGVIHPSKGHLEAIEALAIVLRSGRPARLILVGGGKDEKLRLRIAELGIVAAVELTGFLEDPSPVLVNADAFLMCSRNEAMGRVTAEAMACGLPVIGHASGGTLELVVDGVTGLMYTEGPVDLAEHMIALMADPSGAQRMGVEGARQAAARFTIERYAQEVLTVYRSVTSGER